MSHEPSTAGFTLVELMVTIAVLAVLMAIAAPNFTDFMRRNNVTAHSNELRASLQFTRGQAVSRQIRTVFCASSDGSNCAATTAPLEDGWLVGASSSSAPATPATVLQINDSVAASVSIVPSGASKTTLVFDSRGALDSATGAEYIVCSKASASDALGTNTASVPGKRVVVNASGRVSVLKLASGADCG